MSIRNEVEKEFTRLNSTVRAQEETIKELQGFVTRENKDKEKIKELRWIIGGLQEEILRLRKEANHD